MAAATKRGSARARLLDAAAECFYSHGVQATGIDTITSTAGVAKMSLYNNFSSKEDLVNAYLEERHQEWVRFYEQRVATATDGRAGVMAVFDAYADHAERAYSHGFRGCGLLNAAAELPADAAGRQIVRKHKEEIQALLASHLETLDGLDPTRVAPLAEQLAFLLEGAIVRAGLEGNSRLVKHARTFAEQLVDAAVGR